MVGLVKNFRQLREHRVLVVGDLMLDTYTEGKIRRISPEAPVSVLQVEKETARPGGAGNVMLNSVSLGAQVFAVGRIGSDDAGQTLKDRLQQEGVDTKGLFVEEGYKTPVKNRLIASNQQILRVDHEHVAPASDTLVQQTLKYVESLLDRVEVVAISDYGKGFLTSTLTQRVIALARQKEVPVIVDPKGIDFAKYRGCTLIKPNYSEALLASQCEDGEALEKVASILMGIVQAQHLVVTRSEFGMSVFSSGYPRRDFPVRAREVRDVTGAGDTVLATLTAGLACGLTVEESIHWANIAAGLAIQHLGCARITLAEIAYELLKMDCKNKVFDARHHFALEAVLKNQPYEVLVVEGNQGLTSSIFQAIRRYRYDAATKLLVSIRDGENYPEFVAMVASLMEVDFIVLDQDVLEDLFAQVSPRGTHVIEEEMYSLT